MPKLLTNPPPVHVLSTRPQADAEADCAFLAKHNITAIPAPMLVITPRNFTLAKPHGFDAVIFTSRHAPNTFATQANQHAHKHVLSLPCYAVGTATAKAAKAVGFTSVTSGSGDGKGLVALLTDTPHKKLCWASAEVTSFDIKDALEKTSDKRVEKLVVYDALPTPEFNADALRILRRISPKILQEDGLVLALIHSGRAGAQFRHLLDQHAPTSIPRITLIVASQDVARQCGQGWHSIHKVPLLGRNAMLALAIKLAGAHKQSQ